VLVAFGVLGWTMKRHGWARAPLILGFVLGKLIEKYLFISVGRYQFEWLERPGVIAIFSVTAMVLLWPLGVALYRQWRPAPAAMRTEVAAAETPTAKSGHSIDDVIGRGIWLLAALGLAAAFWSAAGWRLSARLMPQTAAASGLIVIACAAVMVLAAKLQGRPPSARRSSHDSHGPAAELDAATVYRRFGVELLWLVGFLIGVWLIGLMPTMGAFMFLYMATAGRTRWSTALVITVALWIGFYVLFGKLLHVPWPPSLLGDTFPDLRELTGRLI
jgi:Tripartite tricarboxylate transporter TctB family